MSRAARTARIRLSPTTAAAIGTAPSVRALPPRNGWLSARPSCCRCRTFMCSTRFQPSCATSPIRTRPWSTTCYSRPQTTLTIAADPKHLGARIGFISVLHTWGSALVHHPHVHMIVPGGGFSPDGSKWIACRPRYFLTVEVLSALFRRLFLEMLLAAHQARRLLFFGDLVPLTDKVAFAAFLKPLRKIDWVVDVREPFAGPKQVLRYLSRYTHRVAISNRRLISADENGVTFRYKDYRIDGPARYKTMTLAADEFIRRFLIHVLPKRFHRIRHYGLLASGNRAANIARARELLGMPSPANEPEPPAAKANDEQRVLPRPCPCCGGRMIIIETFAREPRQRPTPMPQQIRIDTS